MPSCIKAYFDVSKMFWHTAWVLPSVTTHAPTHRPGQVINTDNTTQYSWHSSTVIKRLFRGERFLWVIISALDNWLAPADMSEQRDSTTTWHACAGSASNPKKTRVIIILLLLGQYFHMLVHHMCDSRGHVSA